MIDLEKDYYTTKPTKGTFTKPSVAMKKGKNLGRHLPDTAINLDAL